MAALVSSSFQPQVHSETSNGCPTTPKLCAHLRNTSIALADEVETQYILSLLKSYLKHNS